MLINDHYIIIDILVFQISQIIAFKKLRSKIALDENCAGKLHSKKLRLKIALKNIALKTLRSKYCDQIVHNLRSIKLRSNCAQIALNLRSNCAKILRSNYCAQIIARPQIVALKLLR